MPHIEFLPSGESVSRQTLQEFIREQGVSERTALSYLRLGVVDGAEKDERGQWSLPIGWVVDRTRLRDARARDEQREAVATVQAMGADVVPSSGTELVLPARSGDATSTLRPFSADYDDDLDAVGALLASASTFSEVLDGLRPLISREAAALVLGTTGERVSQLIADGVLDAVKWGESGTQKRIKVASIRALYGA